MVNRKQHFSNANFPVERVKSTNFEKLRVEEGQPKADLIRHLPSVVVSMPFRSACTRKFAIILPSFLLKARIVFRPLEERISLGMVMVW